MDTIIIIFLSITLLFVAYYNERVKKIQSQKKNEDNYCLISFNLLFHFHSIKIGLVCYCFSFSCKVSMNTFYSEAKRCDGRERDGII